MSSPSPSKLSLLISKLDSSSLMDLIRIAETSERYKDMTKMLKLLIINKTSKLQLLNDEEKNLFCVGYKNIVGELRSSYRILTNIDDNEISIDLLNKYKNVIESELDTICNEVLSLLEKNVLPLINNKNSKDEVFYKKMIGDYYRYKSEYNPNDLNKKLCEKYYLNALNISKKILSETDPVRLGLSLNFSVCYFEILNNNDNAISLAREAFDGAICKLDDLKEEYYKDTTLIMQLLRDNLALWVNYNDNNNNNNNNKDDDNNNDSDNENGGNNNKDDEDN